MSRDRRSQLRSVVRTVSRFRSRDKAQPQSDSKNMSGPLFGLVGRTLHQMPLVYQRGRNKHMPKEINSSCLSLKGR